jgi:hypothetical protein
MTTFNVKVAGSVAHLGLAPPRARLSTGHWPPNRLKRTLTVQTRALKHFHAIFPTEAGFYDYQPRNIALTIKTNDRSF